MPWLDENDLVGPGDSPTFPRIVFRAAIGDYLSDDTPGSTFVDFQALLAWEAKLGTCEKPAANQGAEDWIDRLMSAVDQFSIDHSDTPLTLQDLILTVKDWLIQKPFIESNAADLGIVTTEVAQGAANEVTLLQDLFGGHPMSTALIDIVGGTEGLESKVRDYCGVLLHTPQFLLANLGDEVSAQVPKLQVCNQLPCTYQQWCWHYNDSLNVQGVRLACSSDRRVSEIREDGASKDDRTSQKSIR